MPSDIVNKLDIWKAEIEAHSHPAAKKFPLLVDTDPEAWEEFVADIRANGLQVPIVIDRPPTDPSWMLLEGRNRKLACDVLGILPDFQVCNVQGGAAVARVITGNLRRRHDDAGTRAMQTAELLAMLKAENFPVPTITEAAKAAGVSDRSVRTANALRDEAPELAAEVGKGHITLNSASEIAKTPPGLKRDRIVQEVREADDKKKAKRLAQQEKAKKNTGQESSGNEVADPFLGYTDLLTVMERLPRLSHELRRLEKTPRGMTTQLAIKLKSAMTSLMEIDFGELRAAAVSLDNVLDLSLRIDKANAEEVKDQPDITADRVKEAAAESADAPPPTPLDEETQRRWRNPLTRLLPRGSG
jgi:hypothetical protein